MGRTLVEKIANQYATGLDSGQSVRAHDYISIRPLHDFEVKPTISMQAGYRTNPRLKVLYRVSVRVVDRTNAH